MAKSKSDDPQHNSYKPVDPDDPFRQAVLALLREKDPKAADRYGNCHREGHGLVKYCPSDPNHYYCEIPCFCMQRICNLCSEYIAARERARYEPIISAVTKQYRRGWGLKLVTLTRSIQLSADIGDEVLKTLDCARDLYYRLWGREEGAGGIACLEVGEHGQKIHVHLIIYGMFFWKSEVSERAHKSKKYAPLLMCSILAGCSASIVAAIISHAFWSVEASGEYVSETWQELTGDYIVDVQKTTPERAVREGLKYITKFVNLSPAQLVDLHMALKGKRRIRSWGCFYGVEEQKPEGAEAKACPVCGLPLTMTTEGVFVHILLRAQEEADTALLLDLTEANKSPPDKQLQLTIL